MADIRDLISLKGKVAVITGGASGIGFAAADLLSKAGAHIAILDIQINEGEKAELNIRKNDPKAKFIECDVTSDKSCMKAINKVIDIYGKIDILFNNAGISIRKNCVDLEEHEWDLALNVGLKGMYLISHYTLPFMIEQGSGSIINTGSGWSLKGGPNAISYCAMKGGVLNLTRAMTIDHGPNNIRVNCICPGDIDTPLLRSECEQLGENEEDFMKEAAERPLNRVGKPVDVAYAVLFFASEMSEWITGSHLVVDGGGIA